MYKLMNLEVLLEKFADNHKSIWAHTKEGERSETLLEHSLLCLDYYNKYSKVKGIDNIVRNVIISCGCTVEETNILYDMFVNAIYYHDIGKVNPYYQSRRLNNSAYKGRNWEYDGNPNHALPSAYIYMSEFMPLIEGRSKRKLSYYLFAFAYCIARHHGYLKNTDGFRDDIMACPVEQYYKKSLNITNINFITSDASETKIKKIISDEIAFYILNKLMYA